jgi:hypothetical protein
MIASAAEEHGLILSMLPGWRATLALGPAAAAIRDSG